MSAYKYIVFSAGPVKHVLRLLKITTQACPDYFQIAGNLCRLMLAHPGIFSDMTATYSWPDGNQFESVHFLNFCPNTTLVFNPVLTKDPEYIGLEKIFGARLYSENGFKNQTVIEALDHFSEIAKGPSFWQQLLVLFVVILLTIFLSYCIPKAISCLSNFCHQNFTHVAGLFARSRSQTILPMHDADHRLDTPTSPHRD